MHQIKLFAHSEDKTGETIFFFSNIRQVIALACNLWFYNEF